MPANKKQHYLPVSYLKYFSDDQTSCIPQSKIWRCDTKGQQRVPIKSQCFGDYFYSKENPTECEQDFQKREVLYCKFVDELRAGKDPSQILYGDLFLNMADLYLRNAIHKNLTEDEGLEAYNARLELFFGRLLLGKTSDAFSLDDENIKKHLLDNWRMEIISAPQNIDFVTSDIGYSTNAKTGVVAIAIPFWVDSTGERRPPLDSVDRNEFVPVLQWWEQIVMGSNQTPTRKAIVLGGANQDGGAHVDAAPNKTTKELSAGVGTFQSIQGGTIKKIALANHHFPLLRQFAYEVLNSPDVWQPLRAVKPSVA